MLTAEFGDNQLHDTNEFKLVIDRQEDLKGLPPSVARGGRGGKGRKLPGKWVNTLQAPSIWPFLQYATTASCGARSGAYTSRGDHDDQWDNKKTASRIAALRVDAHSHGLQELRRLRLERTCRRRGWRLQPAQPAVDASAQRGAQGSRRPAGDDSTRRPGT